MCIHTCLCLLMCVCLSVDVSVYINLCVCNYVCSMHACINLFMYCTVLYCRAFFTTLFATISSNGGNSVRFWLHPDGSALPVVNGDYSARIVDKPSSTHIASMQFLLNLGAQYNVLINFCLWSFDMVNDVGYGIQFGRWNKILTSMYR